MDDRRTIDELISRYRLEPELRDVYCEGPADARFLQLFLEDDGQDEVVVYTISSVNIPRETVLRHDLGDLQNNQRGRVIALALELEASLGATPQVTCVVDRDFDDALARSPSFPQDLDIDLDQCEDLLVSMRLSCSLLLKTDYACLEMYMFDRNLLLRLFRVSLPNEVPLDEFAFAAIDQLCGILRELFLVRLSNLLFVRKYRHLGFSVQSMTFDRCLSLTENGIVEFQSEEYVRRYLSSSGLHDFIDEFTSTMDYWRTKLSADIRQSARTRLHNFDSVVPEV